MEAVHGKRIIIVEGAVWVESHPGRGTTVFVSLPQPTTPQEEAWAGGYGAR